MCKHKTPNLERSLLERFLWITFRGYPEPLIHTTKRINLVDFNEATDPRDGFYIAHGKDDACFAEGSWTEWVSFAWAVIRRDMYLRVTRPFRKKVTS